MKKSTRQSFCHTHSFWLFVLPSLALFAVFFMVPLILSIWFSFTNYDGWKTMDLIGLKNYTDILKDTDFYKTVGRTLIYTVCNLPFKIAVPLLLAALVTSKLVKGKTIMRTLIYIPVLLSALVAGITINWMFGQEYGLINFILQKMGIDFLQWSLNPILATVVISVASNWISAGYSLWFLREARFLNFSRMQMGTGCAISGTGFLVSAQVVRENGGWPFHLLTEDIQFSIDCAVQGRRIGYCDKAVVYDEQPTTFQQSWTQRMRWSKGFYQVAARYIGGLFRGCFTQKKGRFACYDMMMTVAPGMLLTMGVLGINIFIFLSALTEPRIVATELVQDSLLFVMDNLFNFYLVMLLYGAVTLAVEWKAIHARAVDKVIYLFTFPLFMLTYIPISLAALVRRVEWKPIRHNSSASLKAKNGSLT